MIKLVRLPGPEILERKGATWTRAFLGRRSKKANHRPSSSQYAHKSIKATLTAMSHGKCFYCETLLDEDEQTVDHYIEIAEAPEHAFTWTNLYLACSGCQSKLSEEAVPRATCLDPCDPDVNPADHLVFERAIVRSQNDSDRGRQTIEKYKLDRGDLELRRHRQLDRFKDVLVAILKRQNNEQRGALTAEEKAALLRFKQREHPYSAMFACVLREHEDLLA